MVYYANYLRFAERARTEWLRSKGYDQCELWRNHNTGFVVRNCVIEYHKPAFLDDMLQIATMVIAKTATSITMEQIISRDKQLISTIKILLVCVNAEFRPQKMLLNID